MEPYELEIDVKYHVEGITLERHGDWIDLCAAETVELEKGDFKLIPLGVSIKLPDWCEGWVVPRSSTFGKYGIVMANSIGIIDHDYCGNDDEWMFPAYATREVTILKGARIAQFRMVGCQPPVKITVVEDLKSENRGGFGSTGI